MQRKKAMADVKVKVMKTRLACQDHSLYDFKTFSSFAFETVKIIFAVNVAEVNTYYYLN